MKIKRLPMFGWGSAFAILCVIGLACARSSGDSMDALPAVRVAIGMPVSELRSGSTYHFGRAPERNEREGTEVFSIHRPYDLVYLNGGKELKLSNIGEQFFMSAIMIINGKVDNLSITPQHQKLTLNEAMTEGNRLFRWFESVGFKASAADKIFYVIRANGKESPGLLSSFDATEMALKNPETKIEEMQLFSLRKGGDSVNLTLRNARRMEARFEKQTDDESNAAQEREYYLDLFITHLE